MSTAHPAPTPASGAAHGAKANPAGPKRSAPSSDPAPPQPGIAEQISAESLNSLIASYLKPADVAKVDTAFEMARAAHEGQTRQSGEPYITHPLAVATLLAQWHLDAQALIAALLHDVVEDTPTTKAEIAKQFGKPVAELVDGVSKLDKLQFATLEEAQAENFRKMLLAMARDVRVILIKLADRLHNMRTLDAVPPAKQERVA